ncbi:response regulator [Melioribacteraceae bacterium 4301-Me]|uniref:response regulator n=1 Tax=Pyranulibacter aquaticus TaxID=3163344 RepID=UPI00359B1266
MKRVILVVEDSPTIRKFVSFSMLSHGYNVIAASDGMEALEKLPYEKIDLIITDLNMPNIDGLELVRTVRRTPEFKDIPIIILSSLSSQNEVQEGLRAGANSYLIKPFDPKRVVYEVSKYLN